MSEPAGGLVAPAEPPATAADSRRSRSGQTLVAAAALVIVVAGLRAAAPFLLPLLVAILLSILSLPVLAWLLRHRLPRLLAVILTVLANLVVVIMLLLPVGGSINSFIIQLPKYQARLEAMTDATIEWLDDRGIDTSELTWLQGIDTAPRPVPPAVAADIEGTVVPDGRPLRPADRLDEMEEEARLLDLSAIVELVTGTLKGLAAIATRIFLVVLIMVFILGESSALPAKLQLAFRLGSNGLGRLLKAQREIQHYLAIKTGISLVTGLAAGCWVWLLGVDFPLLWGLVAFLLNYIPNLGSIVAAVPPTVLSLVEGGLGPALVMALGYLVINVTFGNLLEPHLMGRRLGLSTLVVFLSLIFWGWIWGPVGMLLSVPLTMSFKIAFENTKDLRWVAVLLGPNPSLPPVRPLGVAAIPAESPAAPVDATGG